MNKKVMTLAVASALAAPAAVFAQAPTVQLYGRINTGYDNYSATGSTAGTTAAGVTSDFKGRSRIFDSGSRLGVRGTENLGNGLSAVFQIENGVNIDSGDNNGQSGVANASTGFFASRDSYLGLQGNWGRVTFGRQSLYWTNGAIDQQAANYVNSGIPWTSTGVSGRLAGVSARINNVALYTSPTWNGFYVTAGYSANGGGGNNEGAASGTGITNSDASVWAVRAAYNGMFNLQYDYGVNQAASVSTVATRLKIVGQKIGVSWPYQPGARISLLTAQTKNDNGVVVLNFRNAGDSVKQSHVTLVWEHTFGNLQAMASWGKLRTASGCSATAVQGAIANTTAAQNGCDGTDANAYMLGLRYNMSKRTALYTTYNRINNGSNQHSNYAAGGYASAGIGGVPSASVGADPRIWAIGIHHNF